MLEEAIPALWSAVHGFFTPAVLFILLNLVIGTIAVTSKASPSPPAADAANTGAAGGADPQRRLSRVPSMAFERIRSFNLSRFTEPAPEPAAAETGAADLGYEQPQSPPEKEEEAPAPAEPDPEPEREPEHPPARSRSDAQVEAEAPRLLARLHKSASEKSAFSHFEAQEVEEAVQAVEKRRPATTTARRGGRRRLPVQAAEPPSEPEQDEQEEQEAGGEVDAQAENFINRFHNQLKLQRMESILRYRETIRSQAAAGGV